MKTILEVRKLYWPLTKQKPHETKTQWTQHTTLHSRQSHTPPSICVVRSTSVIDLQPTTADEQSIQVFFSHFGSRTLSKRHLAQALNRSFSSTNSFVREIHDPLVKTNRCAHYHDDCVMASHFLGEIFRNSELVLHVNVLNTPVWNHCWIIVPMTKINCSLVVNTL